MFFRLFPRAESKGRRVSQLGKPTTETSSTAQSMAIPSFSFEHDNFSGRRNSRGMQQA
jgi:hypothetical protein